MNKNIEKWLAERGLTEEPKCHCGGKLKWLGYKTGFRKNCSKKCADSNPDRINKIKQTNIKKYGAVSPLLNENVKAKAHKTLKENFGVEYVGQIRRAKREKAIIEYVKNEEIHGFTELVNTLKSLDKKLIVNEDKLMIELEGFDVYYIQYINNKTIKPKYYYQDIVLSSVKKVVLVDQMRWLSNKELWINMLKARYESIETFRASEFEIREVSPKIKNLFLDKNHIQGADRSNINYGLFKDDKLYSIMTFCKPRFNKHYQWELSRFCTLKEYRIHGGASKLMKHFEKSINPKNIITYACLNYSTGGVYKHLGFISENETPPNYIWSNNKDRMYSRYMVMTDKYIEEILEDYDPLKSLDNNMIANGYNKIYDAGSLRFVKECG